MKPQWPASLPQFLQSTADESLNPRLSAIASVGYGKIGARSMSYSRAELLSGTMILTQAQRDVLIDFFHIDTADGNLSFEGPLDNSGLILVYSFNRPPEITANGAVFNSRLDLTAKRR